MKYVLMIYQGPTPTLPGSDRWKALPEAEQKAIYADYAEISKAPGAAPEATINLALKHGVRAALEYAASGDIAKARAATNPDVAPHLEFVDMAGHGYAVVSAGPDAIDTEFVCIVRPIARAATPDGGPLRYRVSHRASLWRPGTPPKLEQRVLEGDAKLSV